MNIDLKDSLLRFVVPPCLFWSVLFLSKTLTSQSIQWPFTTDPFIILIFFVASGFIIGAVGTLVSAIVDKHFKPDWQESPLRYWQKIGVEKEYVQRKIERTWNFYTVNINSTIALAGALYFILSVKDWKSFVILFCICVVFVILSIYNYRKLLGISKDLPKK